MYLNKTIGQIGENLACQYLVNNNYKILDRNFRCKQGEIDIITYDISKNELVFIEVKTRSNFHYGRPVDSINKIKQKHIFNAANYFIYKNGINNTFIRFDVIEILIKNYSHKINHIKQIL